MILVTQDPSLSSEDGGSLELVMSEERAGEGGPRE